jgi:GNAT superfamily N-acetyltransferase
VKKFEIRAAKELDIPDMLDLSREGFHFDYEFDKTINLNWSDTTAAADYFRSRISEDDRIAVVATKHDKPVAYLVGGLAEPYFYRNIDRIAELESMLVTEAERGHGVGTELVNTFFEWCRSRKCARTRVEASSANLRAVNFYRRCGFSDYSSILEGTLNLGTLAR